MDADKVEIRQVKGEPEGLLMSCPLFSLGSRIQDPISEGGPQRVRWRSLVSWWNSFCGELESCQRGKYVSVNKVGKSQ